MAKKFPLQESLGTPLGQSITKKYLSLEGDELSRFMSWLTTLFSQKK